MDYGILISGIVIGSTVTAIAINMIRPDATARQDMTIKAQTETIKSLIHKLSNLRRNAYLTNEHGHRVRYSKASAEVRARAEAGE